MVENGRQKGGGCQAGGVPVRTSLGRVPRGVGFLECSNDLKVGGQ